MRSDAVHNCLMDRILYRFVPPSSRTEPYCRSVFHRACRPSHQLIPFLSSRFPKAVVDVYCCVLESGGSDVAVAIAAASLALSDAGIELYDLVSACTVANVAGNLLLDPTSDEVSQSKGTLTLAMMPSANEVTQLQLTGEWSSVQQREAMELAMGGCAQLKAVIRQTLIDAVAQQ